MGLAAALFSITLAGIAADNLSSDIDAPSMDKSVAPGVDFYTYANGAWIANHPYFGENRRLLFHVDG